jgi:hypothetical protein
VSTAIAFWLAWSAIGLLLGMWWLFLRWRLRYWREQLKEYTLRVTLGGAPIVVPDAESNALAAVIHALRPLNEFERLRVLRQATELLDVTFFHDEAAK